MNKQILLFITTMVLVIGAVLFAFSSYNKTELRKIDKKEVQTEVQHEETKHKQEVSNTPNLEDEAKKLASELTRLSDGQYAANYKVVNGVKEFKLVAIPVKWETSKGEIKEAWSYNGVVPGPQIRVTEGDKVRIVVENKLSEATTAHWHGLLVPNAMDGVPGVTQDAIEPGKSFTYEFTVKNSGTHMYHTHTNTLMQTDKGLFGNFIVEPKKKEKTFDREYALMLSDGSMGYLINGKSFPETVAYHAKPGEKVRVRVTNIGNQVHPMHLHGHSFKIVAKDGYDIPENMQLTQDTLDLMPGDRYDVEFVATDGVWLFHCHVLPHVHAGHEDKGMIQVIDVK